MPDRPVVLRAWDYHTVWSNSRALELAGLDADTPEPADGIILRRPDGSPLGTLIESGATDAVLRLLPPVSVEEGVEAGDLDTWVAAAHRGALAVDADLALRADPNRWADQTAELDGLRAPG